MSSGPSGDGGRGQRPPWTRGQRPAWWPEGEPWPPQRPPWARYRGRFVRRFFLVFIVAIILVALFGGALGWLAARGFARTQSFGSHPFVFFPLFPLLLILLLIWLAGRGMSTFARPLDALAQAARRIESGDYSVRVAERGSEEVRSMARAFNAMSARLQATDNQRRSFLADVTHELKTPLSIIRGQAEGIADGLYPADEAHLAPIVEATRTLERLADDLRTLALSEAGSLQLSRERIDLAVVIDDTMRSFRQQASTGGIELREEVASDLPGLEADPVRIGAVLRNLLSNALRHTPRGGTVIVKAFSAAKSVLVEVENTGSNIPEDLLPRVFDRFVKGPGSEGSGLGLSIARDIIVAHNGTITAENQPQRGAVFRFTLPVES